jgi:AraC-like DNA-binding protein
MSGHFAPPDRLVAPGVGALRMPVAYLRLFLRRFGRRPDQSAAILEGTGVSPAQAMAAEPDDSIQLWQQLRQVENLARIAPAAWALDVGPALQGSAHGALGAAIATAADLDRALGVLERFGRVRAPYFQLRRATIDARHAMTIELLLQLEPELARPLLELLLISLQALVESALGEPMREARFAVPFPAPPYADRYRDALHAPMAFDAEATSVSIPAAWLALACPFADASQHQQALSTLEALERALEGPGAIVAHVERILETCPGAPPGADEVAARLHLSRRTLVRRLAACGTSFRALADAHRRRRAEQLLAEPHLTIEEVGDRLGYTDPANFGRAVRRWFGASPTAVRARLW